MKKKVQKYISEKDVENVILEYLYFRGIFAWKNQSTGVFDTQKKCFRKSNNKFHINGTADILGILLDGRMLCIEVKSPSNKKRPEDQKRFLDKVNELGGVAFFADSVKVVEDKLVEIGLNKGLLI